jgi:hypothetical protein
VADGRCAVRVRRGIAISLGVERDALGLPATPLAVVCRLGPKLSIVPTGRSSKSFAFARGEMIATASGRANCKDKDEASRLVSPLL